jgi:hypothetical protein
MSACDQDSGKPSEANPSEWPVISTIQNKDQNITVVIRRVDGSAITLGLDPVPGTDPNGTVAYNDTELGFVAKLWMKQHPQDTQIVDVDAVYKGNGQFKLMFSSTNTSQPGIFLADIFIFDKTGNIYYQLSAMSKLYSTIQISAASMNLSALLNFV